MRRKELVGEGAKRALAYHRVKLAPFTGQSLRVADLEPDLISQLRATRFTSRGLDAGWAEIDAGDLAAKPPGERQAGRTPSRSNVKDA